jgi:hypothetical protein
MLTLSLVLTLTTVRNYLFIYLVGAKIRELITYVLRFFINAKFIKKWFGHGLSILVIFGP